MQANTQKHRQVGVLIKQNTGHSRQQQQQQLTANPEPSGSGSEAAVRVSCIAHGWGGGEFNGLRVFWPPTHAMGREHQARGTEGSRTHYLPDRGTRWSKGQLRFWFKNGVGPVPEG
jgi:hypothetical protein